MSSLRTDSPVSLSIVTSFLQFLSSVEAASGTDTEGLEVATQCLSEVFRLNASQNDTRIRLLPLVELFSAGLGPAAAPASPGPAVRGADFPPTAPPAPPVGSSAGRSESEPSATEPRASSRDSLLEQFREGLDLAGYFEGTMQGTPEYTEKFEQAKQTLDSALKKVKSSSSGPKWSASYSEETLALAEAFKIQGNTTMSALRYHDAIQLYTLAISLCSNNAIFYSNRAAALTQVGKYDEAIADCEVAIKLDPQYSKAYSRMGMVYFTQGRLQEAIEKGFRKALELDPSSTSIQESLRAAQQKLEEQRRAGQHQERSHPGESQTSGTFSASTGPMNMPLPPEIANLLPSILNLAAQFGPRAQENQSQTGSNQSAGDAGSHPATGMNFTNGDGVQMDPDGGLDGNFNVTFDGQQLPPQYAGLMQSVFQQMFGAAPGQAGWPPANNQNPNNQPGWPPANNQNPNNQPGPPGGT